MKVIYIVRHAKSSWKHDVDDIDRPLNKRGKSDAKRMALHTKAVGFPVDAVFISPAKRTQKTANFFIKHWNIDQSICKIVDDLYDFSGNDLLKVIQNTDDSITYLMLFGHNYALTDFINTYGNWFTENLPTAGFAVIHFKTETWKNLINGTTTYLRSPKMLK